MRSNVKVTSSILYDTSQRIKELREKKKLTQEQLGVLVGVKGKTISGYENDISFPSLEVLITLASVLGVSTDELLGVAPIDYSKIIETSVDISDLTDNQKDLIIRLVNDMKTNNKVQ